MRKIYFTIIFWGFATISCTKENVEELSDSCNTDQVTYETIKITFENNCVQCHNVNYSNDNIRLDSYEGVKDAAGNTLLKAIKHEPGVTPMPYNGTKLSDCEIKSIESWINKNFPK